MPMTITLLMNGVGARFVVLLPASNCSSRVEVYLTVNLGLLVEYQSSKGNELHLLANNESHFM